MSTPPEADPMTRADKLERGREALSREAWGEAYAHLSAAHADNPLDLADLERLASSAHLVGREEEATDLWAHAHQEFLREGRVPDAARCAFWLGRTLVHRGEHARGGGWFARATRVLEESGRECVEQGYLLLPAAMRAVGEGHLEEAVAALTRAVQIGERYSDRDLVTMARHGRGRILIRMGRTAEGVALLDEVMVAVTASELSCMIVGEIYCSVLEACQETHDLHRAREWTEAMTRWLESQPDLVPYRGQCLVHRSEVMQLCGKWDEAMDEVKRACQWLTRPPGQPAAGAAYYQQAELHRLRGEVAEAEEAYREASRWGRRPEPGLPLLRLTQGQVDVACAAICRAVDEARERWKRSPLLAAQIDILLAAGQREEARAAGHELREISEALDADLLRAAADGGEGAVLLADGQPREALRPLRRAWEAWRKLEAPYEAARVRVLIGRACREVGDEDAAELEMDAARRVFRELGAVPDLARMQLHPRRAATAEAATAPGGLTPREVQVLRLLSTGQTNRQIAGELFISERTVERHVSNIFTKLGLSSRAAATAYAYQHDLV